ncbi:GNAT family N-acetyltransferase [Streptomyces oceani]|uniref:Acetyltransferase n=1 Tax=Streptomyces oceani TaxID=1075402 RepID=A0A1E7JYD8_9ACTN|nr:acetyltransferase [Streptomyces oceani]
MAMSVTISAATDDDVEQILKLQYLCFQPEAERHGDYGIEPLVQTLDQLRAELDAGYVVVARLGAEVIGSVRATVEPDTTARISMLCVHPRMHRHGLGSRLLTRIEEHVRTERAATRYRLSTGHADEVGLRLYRRNGYTPVDTVASAGGRATLVTLEKEASATAFTTSA